MSQLPRNTSRLGKRLGRKRRKPIPILFMTRKRKHLTTEPHELDPVFIIPSKHLYDIPCIRESDFFDVSLPAFEGGGLGLVGSVFDVVFWGRGVSEWVAVVEDGLDAACAGAEDGGVAESEVGVEACLEGFG
jgi:hypothetical protein